MKLTALIVTFNRLAKLKQCWFMTASIGFTHIIIVDNASTDGTGEWLAKLDDPRLILLSQQQNIGGAGGFKLGASYASERIETDWVVFYDDDSWPPDNFLECFNKIKDECWGAYCCKVVDMHKSLCKMNLPYSDLPRTFRSDLNTVITGHDSAPDGQTVQDVSSFSFVGAIVKREILEKSIDYIHSELFIYYDDLYFSYHVKLLGCRIRYSPEIIFTHDIPPPSSGITPNWKVYYLIRNLILSQYLFPSKKPYSRGSILLRICKYLLAIHTQPKKLEYISYIFRAVVDGMLHKVGKRH